VWVRPVCDLFEQARLPVLCSSMKLTLLVVSGWCLGGGNDERGANPQPVVDEMDGFEGILGLFLCCHNRPDVLDAALLRLVGLTASRSRST